MSLDQVYDVERSKWDAIAAEAMPQLRELAPESTFASHLRNSLITHGIAEFLGDVRGKKVLEYGCGLGLISTLLAKSGAHVVSFDLSPASVAVARQRAALNHVEVELAVAAGEHLPYADESFDIIFGKAILHHLDVNIAVSDLYRVLKKGGKAAFAEPMGMNPILNFVRDGVWYPHKHPRGADKPLTYDEIAAWGKQFSSFTFREVQLLSMLERGLGFGKRLKALRRADDWLLERFPSLRRYCRYVVMLMEK